MRYNQAFRYLLDRPGGFTNLILVTVCQFIPVLGPIVLLGYRAEVAVALDDDPDMQDHPKFDFDRFVEYLSRGVWPFLISLILSLPVALILIGAFVAGLVIDPPGPGNPPLLAFALFGGALIIATLALTILSVPMTFHAEMTGSFDLGGAFRFTVGFWSRVLGLAIVTWLVYSFLAFVVTFLGLLCCFVGIYPASSLVQMAGQHLMVQLYREYLNRGGEPLAIRYPEEKEDYRDRDRDRDRDPSDRW